MQNFIKDGEQDAVRCNTRADLIKRGCKENEIISPKNKRNIAKDDPLSASQNGQVVQMRPQKIDLDLRPGQWNRLMLRTILRECQTWFLTDSLQAECAYKNYAYKICILLVPMLCTVFIYCSTVCVWGSSFGFAFIHFRFF